MGNRKGEAPLTVQPPWVVACEFWQLARAGQCILHEDSDDFQKSMRASDDAFPLIYLGLIIAVTSRGNCQMCIDDDGSRFEKQQLAAILAIVDA